MAAFVECVVTLSPKTERAYAAALRDIEKQMDDLARKLNKVAALSRPKPRPTLKDCVRNVFLGRRCTT
jgi:hypothetical protein